MNTELNDNEYYETPDLTLAAVLSLQFPIHRIDKSNPKRSVFHFVRNESLDEIVDQYWNQSLSVEPQELAMQLRKIKTRLYTE